MKPTPQKPSQPPKKIELTKLTPQMSREEIYNGLMKAIRASGIKVEETE
jgi:hypothetical protein